MSRRVLENPILSGCYPDPSITRAGDDFYLVTSSFEYFPGVPLFHSKDLFDFQQVGHVLTRKSQLELTGARSSQGIYAPTLRYHAGRFYMITTNMSHGGTFLVWSNTPEGPWSDPITVGDESWNMDPSLFFDDDGAVYYTRHGGRERGAIYQSRIDVTTGELERQPVEIWRGTGGIWPEGPHLYKIRDYYYLLIAEGGTSYDHSITVARARNPYGPFEPCPRNPILTHRDRRDLPIQATGHGDLVEAPDGSWWMVFLGIRPWDGKHHHLGRETFLAPVSWDSAGWPVVNDGEPIALSRGVDVPSDSPRDTLPTGAPLRRFSTEGPTRAPFAEKNLPIEWVYLRNPNFERYSLSARPNWLRLSGSEATLRDIASPTFVGVRQRAYDMRIAVRMVFTPKHASEQAGLVLRMNEDNYCALLAVLTEVGVRLRFVVCTGGSERVVGDVPLPNEECRLKVSASPERYVFVATTALGTTNLGTADTLPLSSERAGGFTGVVIGLYATGSGAQADFTDFEAAVG